MLDDYLDMIFKFTLMVLGICLLLLMCFLVALRFGWTPPVKHYIAVTVNGETIEAEQCGSSRYGGMSCWHEGTHYEVVQYTEVKDD